ncbi:MAG: hypothetical protein ACRC6J_05745 [Cetobacterium sp.]|uniref:hypothetical protein n=1 Tax=Cetobacterium sp. TaxID=2071632 RepID=UPI003F4011F2
MKKIFILMLMISSIANAGLKDGKYTSRTDKTIWFWYPYTEMIVKNGEVISVYHDRIKNDGSKASEDESYNKNMAKKQNVNPALYSKLIPENYFKAGKNLQKMDEIAGATDSVNHFKKQMQMLLQKAETEGPGDYIIKKSEL